MPVAQYVFLFVVMLVTSPVWATTYYVAPPPTGSDSRSAAEASNPNELTPWASLLKCAQDAAVVGGDQCLLKNGTYTMGAWTINKSGSTGQYIKFKNYPGHTPVLQGSDLTTSQMSLQGNWLWFEGLEVKNVRNAFHCSGSSGCKNFVFTANHIHDTGGSGINMQSSGGAGSITNVIISRNNIHHINYTTRLTPGGNGTFWTYAMYLEGTNYSIINNKMWATSGACMQLRIGLPDFSGLIANNTCAYNSNQQGVLIFKDGSGGTGTGIRFENNIFFQPCFGAESLSGQCTTNALGSGITRVAVRLLDMGAIGMTFKNNVVYDTDDPTGVSPFDCASSGAIGQQNAAWCVANGWVVSSGNSTTTNPNMVTASTGSLPSSPDFHLTSGSVAINFGLDLSGTFTNDYDNVTRTVPFDVGAYEFGGLPPDTTPPAAPTGLMVQ